MDYTQPLPKSSPNVGQNPSAQNVPAKIVQRPKSEMTPDTVQDTLKKLVGGAKGVC